MKHLRNQTPEVESERSRLLAELGQLARERLALQKALAAVEARFTCVRDRVIELRGTDER